MEYLLENGKYSSLGRHNVDFGGGLVRYAMISQGVDSIYETDIYKPIFIKIKELSVSGNIESQRIITDHILASTWAIMDGVIPSNSMQGYILRRLIRRAMRHARKLGIEGTFTKEIGEICIEQFKQVWPKLEEKKETILRILGEEEDKFNKTLEKGLKELDRLIQNKKELTGEDIFKMYETYGLPKEVIEEILKERNIQITNIEGFENAKKIHQDKSRTSSAGLFKGGLADTSEMSTKYHTATHLLLSALRKVLGEHVYQKGSNITTERLRLDFPNGSKLTAEQIRKVEDIVNSVIKEGLDITYKEVKKEEALKLVPFAAFEEKYGETVKLYYIGDVNNPFSIETNVGAGVKRIKAVLE